MASNTWEKRQREKAKREKKELKRAKRDEKRDLAAGEVEEGPTSEELMAQFAALNREFAAGSVDEPTFRLRKNEIWLAMGLPADNI